MRIVQKRIKYLLMDLLVSGKKVLGNI